ncbi:MAG: hypothetical protein HY268_32830 [Deltaproteobacteria bacterium]|nr:hypothetical protein [Deltaproteobacteria bacterium]
MELTFEELANEVMKLSRELQKELLLRILKTLQGEDPVRIEDGILWIGDLQLPMRSNSG